MRNLRSLPFKFNEFGILPKLINISITKLRTSSMRLLVIGLNQRNDERARESLTGTAIVHVIPTVVNPFWPGTGGTVTGLRLEYLHEESREISSSPTFGQQRYQLLLLLTPVELSSCVSGSLPTTSNSASNGSFSLGSGMGNVPAVE